VGKEWVMAKELLEAIDNLELHTMNKTESGRLHEACRSIMTTIEEYWMKWDDPPRR